MHSKSRAAPRTHKSAQPRARSVAPRRVARRAAPIKRSIHTSRPHNSHNISQKRASTPKPTKSIASTSQFSQIKPAAFFSTNTFAISSSVPSFDFSTTTPLSASTRSIIDRHGLAKLNYLPSASTTRSSSSSSRISSPRRGFFGGPSNGLTSALGNMLGKAPMAAAADPGASGQQMSMMQAMKMMQIMQKVMKQMQNGGMDDATHKELCAVIDELTAAGNLPPGQLALFEKIKNREPVTPDQLASLTGATVDQMDQMRRLAEEVKSGKLDTMQFMMKAAGVMQKK